MAQSEWKYRVEGNYNVVFTNINNRSVLRLPKINKLQCRHRTRSKEHASVEIEFLEQVVKLILAGVRVRYKGKRTPLTREFIRKLSALREAAAPERYRYQTLDDSVKFGFVLPNFCRIPLRDDIWSSVVTQPSFSTISVELRPKTCYFPAFDEEPNKQIQNKCHFCLRKIYNKIRHPTVRQTHYCPCDLYSGDSSRVKHAISDLISCPQRYFSVRRADEIVYSNVILSQKLSATNFKGSESVFNQSVFDEKVASYLGTDGKQRFLNIVCNSLQASVVADDKTGYVLPAVKPHCRKDVSNRAFMSETTNRAAEGSILAFLASIHRMRSTPLQQVLALNRKVKSHVESQPNESEVLSMYSPNNVELWKKAIQLSRADTGENNFNDLYTACAPEAIDDVTVAAVALRRYAMSRWFSCCSVIITFQRIDTLSFEQSRENGSRDESVQILSDDMGRDYAVSISLVDLYKDPPEEIEMYGCREDEMLHFLNKHFSHIVQ